MAERPHVGSRPGAERLIERFVPRAAHGARHEILVRAPAELVFEAARDLDLRAHPLARVVFWLRSASRCSSGGTLGGGRPRSSTR